MEKVMTHLRFAVKVFIALVIIAQVRKRFPQVGAYI